MKNEFFTMRRANYLGLFLLVFFFSLSSVSAIGIDNPNLPLLDSNKDVGIELNQLDDVTVPTPADGQVVFYNSSSSEWEAGYVNGTSGANSTSFWSRVGSVLSPVTAGDDVTTTGDMTAINFFGLFNWTDNSPLLSFTGSVLSFNDTMLNESFDGRYVLVAGDNMTGNLTVANTQGAISSGDYTLNINSGLTTLGSQTAVGGTLDPAKTGSLFTLSNGDLTATHSAVDTWNIAKSVNGYSSGVQYFQVTIDAQFSTNGVLIGWANESANDELYLGWDNSSLGLRTGNFFYDNIAHTSSSDFAVGDVILSAYEHSTNTIYWWEQSGGSGAFNLVDTATNLTSQELFASFSSRKSGAGTVDFTTATGEALTVLNNQFGSGVAVAVDTSASLDADSNIIEFQVQSSSKANIDGEGGYTTANGNVTASFFSGDGSLLTGISTANDSYVLDAGDNMTGNLNIEVGSNLVTNHINSSSLSVISASSGTNFVMDMHGATQSFVRFFTTGGLSNKGGIGYSVGFDGLAFLNPTGSGFDLVVTDEGLLLGEGTNGEDYNITFNGFDNEGWIRFGEDENEFEISDDARLLGNFNVTGNITSNGGFFYDSGLNRLGIGVMPTEQTITVNGVEFSSTLSVHAEGGTDLAELTVHRHSNTTGFGSHFIGARSRGNEASEIAVVDGDMILRLDGLAHDGTDYEVSSQIDFEIDGTVGADDMPGRIVFKTTPDGSNAPIEAGRFDSNQNFLGLGDINITGNFTGHQIYGDMWFINNSATGITTTINTINVWENVTGWDATDESGNMLNGFQFESSNALTSQVAGKYKIDYSISFERISGGTAREYEFATAINNIPQNNTVSHRRTGTVNDVGNAGGTGILDLTIGDQVTIMIRNIGGSEDIGVHSINLNLIRIGD